MPDWMHGWMQSIIPSTPGNPVPVPTLSAWGLLLMSALLGLEAVRRRRRKG